MTVKFSCLALHYWRAEQTKTWSFFDGDDALPDVAISALNKRN